MEDGLVPKKLPFMEAVQPNSLNPCCNGRWSRTATPAPDPLAAATVLILVVMEDGLVQMAPKLHKTRSLS